MSIEQDCEQVLVNTVKALTLVDPATNIKYPNVKLQPFTDQYWLEIIILKNTNQNFTWGNERYMPGILQVDICDPFGTGTSVPLGMASQIHDRFIKGTLLYFGAAKVKIEVDPTILSALEDGQYTRFGVSIPYRCYNF